jgi:hypothetical protein
VSKMTNIKVLGIALFAVFAFSAVAAASAFAEDEWLFNNLTFTGELATNTESMLTLKAFNAAGLANTIDCSGLFEGTVTGGGPIALVLDLFNLAMPQVLVEELPGTSLSCETLVDNETCKLSSEAGSETLLWVEELSLSLGLTWEALIELMAVAPIFLLHFHHVAFELSCILLNGLKLESLCEGLTSGKLENITGGVLLEFNEAAPISSERLSCLNVVEGTEVEESTTGLEGDLIIKDTTVGTLSVS